MSITWLILGGCPRSGTTGLMDSLNASSEVGLIPEYNSNRFFGYVENFFKKEDSIQSKSWIGDINLHKRGGAEVITRNFVKYVPDRDRVKEELVRTIFRHTFAKECRVMGEKFPMYWQLDLERIAVHVDHLKILQIVRRPSQVVRSYRHRTHLTKQGLDLWKFNSPLDGFRHWIDGWEACAKRHVGCSNDSFMAVKYEDLLSTTEVYDDIASFLGVRHGEFLPLVEGEATTSEDECNAEIQEAVDEVFGELEERWMDPLDVLIREYPPTELRRRLSHFPGATGKVRFQKFKYIPKGWSQVPQLRAIMQRLALWKG